MISVNGYSAVGYDLHAPRNRVALLKRHLFAVGADSEHEEVVDTFDSNTDD